jgi:hypothetical protein
MPRLETVQVAPGDFDKKYILIEQGGARNRTINPRKLRAIARNWDDASKDTITLVRAADQYLIADGQHRIAAASAHFKHTVTLNAMVWEEDEIDDLADFITAFNRGSPFTAANLMQVYRDRSPWPKAAEQRNLNIGYTRFHGNRYSWTSIMRAVAHADLWRERERFSQQPLPRELLVNEYWLGYTEEGINEVLDALEWWQPVAHAAFLSAQRVGILYGDIALATAISAYRKYRRQPRYLDRIRDRLLASPQIAVLKALDPKQIRSFVRTIVAGFNYHAIKEIADLYGETGRD